MNQYLIPALICSAFWGVWVVFFHDILVDVLMFRIVDTRWGLFATFFVWSYALWTIAMWIVFFVEEVK